MAIIAKLLRRPRGRSVIKAQCQEKTGEKEMFSDVDGRQTEKKMLGCRMAMSSKWYYIISLVITLTTNIWHIHILWGKIQCCDLCFRWKIALYKLSSGGGGGSGDGGSSSSSSSSSNKIPLDDKSIIASCPQVWNILQALFVQWKTTLTSDICWRSLRCIVTCINFLTK